MILNCIMHTTRCFTTPMIMSSCYFFSSRLTRHPPIHPNLPYPRSYPRPNPFPHPTSPMCCVVHVPVDGRFRSSWTWTYMFCRFAIFSDTFEHCPVVRGQQKRCGIRKQNVLFCLRFFVFLMVSKHRFTQGGNHQRGIQWTEIISISSVQLLLILPKTNNRTLKSFSIQIRGKDS